MTGRWYYSGEQISEISKDTLFISRQVNEFLGDPRKLILLSSKGMGKTHLLRQKRANLAQNDEDEKRLVIPVSTGSDIDRQGSFPSNLGAAHWRSIDQKEWTVLWETAIALSILLHYRSGKDKSFNEVQNKLLDFATTSEIPDEISGLIYDWAEGTSVELPTPLDILNSFLKMNISGRKKIFRKFHNQIVQLYKHHITSAVYVFIDSVDQALSETDISSVDLWADGQCGLAVAIYYLSVNCPHIKVYSAIRQEAWNRFEHENKEVIESHCTRLEYSKAEMRRMLDFLSKYYENGKAFGEIFKTCRATKIRNFGVESDQDYLDEDIFEYIYRHSLGSPRSLLHIVNGICTQIERDQRPELLEKDIRREVNLKAGGIAETKINSEMTKFLSFLADPNTRARFFSLLRGNVLRGNELAEISEALGDKKTNVHPFCELFNLGLLGVVKKDTDGDIIQTFKSPMDFEWHCESHIPQSPFYFLHPALEALLSDKYVIGIEHNIVVSNGSEWLDEWTREIEERTFKVFISYSTKNANLRDSVITALTRIFSRENVRFEVWVDTKQIGIAETIGREIDRAIEWADAMICLVTEQYVASNWCKNEFRAMQATAMNDNSKRLFPFVVDGLERKKLGALTTAAMVPEIDSSDHMSILDGIQSVSKWRKDKESEHDVEL